MNGGMDEVCMKAWMRFAWRHGGGMNGGVDGGVDGGVKGRRAQHEQHDGDAAREQQVHLSVRWELPGRLHRGGHHEAQDRDLQQRRVGL